jgi:PAS domain S-box-containing protein
MNESKQSTPKLQNAVTRTVFWGTIALSVITLLVAAYFLTVLSKESKTPVIYVALAVFFSGMLTMVASILITIRGRQDVGVKLAFYTLFALGAGAVGLFQGRAFTAIPSVLMISIIAVRWLFPSGSGRKYAILIAVGFVLMVAIEWIDPPWRIQVTAAKAGPIGAIIFAIVLGGMAISQFRNYSLRTKLLAAFLLVALIPLGIVSFITNRATTQNLTQSSDAALGGVAAQTAAALDTFIAERLNDVRTEAQRHILTEFLTLPKAERDGSETEAALNTDLLAMARRDQTFITSVGLLDKNGLSVADTELTEIGVDKSNRNYFIGARDGQVPYASPIEISGTTGALSMYFSAPVRDSNGEFIGVLRIRYDATVIQSIVRNSGEQANLSSLSLVVLDENHVRLAHNLVPELIFKSVVPLPAETTARLQAEGRLPANKPEAELSTNIPSLEDGLNNLDQDPFFVAEFHEAGEGDEEGTAVRLTAQPWIIAAGQDQDVFLAPLAAQTRTNAIFAFAIAGVVALSAVLVAQTIANPVIRLTGVAQQLAGGDIDVQAQVESRDEIGQLARTFNQMTAQLRELIGSLEQRVAERTRALSSVAEVGTAASTILETNKLLQEVVNLTKERFGFYHAHIYLLNDTGDTLVLASGAGEPGRQMVAEGRSIPLDREQSLVARAGREKKGVAVNDVTEAPDFLPNPLLPDTRSELAVPMLIGEQVIGVFDVQSETIGRFGDADIAVQTTLAAQVASAVQNARLYTQAETSAQEAQSLVDNAPEAIIIVDLETGLFANPNENAIRLYGLEREELVKVGPAQMSPPRQPDGRDSTEKAMEKIGEAMQGATPFFEWMHRNGQGEDFLCEIRLVRMPGEHPRVRASVTDITERKRNEDLTRLRAQQQEALNLITQRIQSATTIEAALQVTARELGRALGMKPTLVTLEPDSANGEHKADS